jgi:dCTP deaminase
MADHDDTRMSEAERETLFAEASEAPGTGVLPSQALRAAINAREIEAARPIEAVQVQPASLDLRLGAKAYRVASSFLPGAKRTVAERLEDLALYEMPLAQGAVLERGAVYIVPLEEHLKLKWRTSATANPKSSIGRLDVFARVITDRGTRFDRIEEGYAGPLFVELAPRSFSIQVRRGSKLTQLRLRRGSPAVSARFHKQLQADYGLIGSSESVDPNKEGMPFTVDVKGAGDGTIIGYRAKRHAGLIDVDKVGVYDPRDFWEPVHARSGQGVLLEPEHFYILASRESVVVPPHVAAEMVAYDTTVGEFRVHYAGFFDPGFGCDETGGAGTRAVLEVRSHEVPFLIEDGQIVGRLTYERLAAPPDTLYGQGVGSYQKQGLQLAKHFEPWPARG